MAALRPPFNFTWKMWRRWVPLPAPDALAGYLARFVWCWSATPPKWQAAQFSTAIFAYRVRGGDETAVAKFYSYKSQHPNERAGHEWFCLQQVRSRRLPGPVEVVQPLALWRGTLLLAHTPGPTWHQFLAAPDTTEETAVCLTGHLAHFLADLHMEQEGPAALVIAHEPLLYVQKLLRSLAQEALGEGQSDLLQALTAVLPAWEGRLTFSRPVLIHGDATSGNVLVADSDRLVVTDWERAGLGDPAQDVGYFLAELTHSLQQAGRASWSPTAVFEEMYGARTPLTPAFKQRIRFYRGAANLRMARNRWLSGETRLALLRRAHSWLSGSR